ncbi:MAG TPA: PEP-CTERM/exosortase system-associated acyltransferase [Sedimenticola thiotaurini]|uniref:PEP-CTERM/exosortase system-associated acyltransferase n=1 Tax=Sedimenticola thiotaurini TaxID=1543721 RepID=A0A831RP03_9GAMM|nr:PEP-CTERM/exosortase system-associated acyltransferase [Sedimenticola thiotaurini]
MFDSRFEVFLANTALSKRIHYQLRYRVFCLDQGFEDPTRARLDQERDQWDKESLHFLVRERSTGQWVATMRMILPQAKPFPVESLCDLSLQDDLTYHRDASCEISRLCIVRRYRGRQALRRPRPTAAPDAMISEGVTSRTEPEIMLGLFRAGLQYSRANGLKQWYFLVTPALARVIGRIGVALTEIGSPVEHRGTRIPYVTDPFRSCSDAMQYSPVIARMFSRPLPAYRLFSEIRPDSREAVA